MSAFLFGSLTFLLVLAAPCAHAYETDQFTLPGKPLQDVGPDFSAYVFEALESTVAETNRRIARQRNRAQIDRLRSPERLAEEVYSRIDGGVELTGRVETWLGVQGKLRKKYGRQAVLKFKPSVFQNVYAWATHIRGALYTVGSSTVNLYGVELGTDKLGHFFKQGIQYFRRYRQQLNHKVAPEVAKTNSIRSIGKLAEGSYFGMVLTGVYSNADLATNLAGMKFYENLLAPVTIGGVTYPAMLRVDADGLISINSGAGPIEHNTRDTIFRRFVSEHMNEALNPSWIEAGPMRAGVRNNVRKRCKAWKARFPELTKPMDDERVRRLSTWYGQDYGHKGAVADLVSIGNVCFEPDAGRR